MVDVSLPIKEERVPAPGRTPLPRQGRVSGPELQGTWKAGRGQGHLIHSAEVPPLLEVKGKRSSSGPRLKTTLTSHPLNITRHAPSETQVRPPPPHAKTQIPPTQHRRDAPQQQQHPQVPPGGGAGARPPEQHQGQGKSREDPEDMEHGLEPVAVRDVVRTGAYQCKPWTRSGNISTLSIKPLMNMPIWSSLISTSTSDPLSPLAMV